MKINNGRRLMKSVKEGPECMSDEKVLYPITRPQGESTDNVIMCLDSLTY